MAGNATEGIESGLRVVMAWLEVRRLEILEHRRALARFRAWNSLKNWYGDQRGNKYWRSPYYGPGFDGPNFGGWF